MGFIMRCPTSGAGARGDPRISGGAGFFRPKLAAGTYLTRVFHLTASSRTPTQLAQVLEGPSQGFNLRDVLLQSRPPLRLELVGRLHSPGTLHPLHGIT